MKWIDEYRSSLKMIEVEELLDLVFYRPLAYLFVKAVYHTNITPNQISLIALIIGSIGGALFAFLGGRRLPRVAKHLTHSQPV